MTIREHIFSKYVLPDIVIEGNLDRFNSGNDDGLFTRIRSCETAGLGGSHPYRDGTVEYYLREFISSNDSEANGPFIRLRQNILVRWKRYSMRV